MFGRELFVVFPDDVVDVAGEAGVAAGEAVGREAFRQECPVGPDGADGFDEAELIPEEAFPAARDGCVHAVEFDVGWYAGEGFGTFVVAEDVEFFDARSAQEGAGQAERYVEDAYRFGGLEALVRERDEQSHARRCFLMVCFAGQA